MCTGNGECVGSTCACDEGWTGNGDFLNQAGIDCQVYLPVIHAMHIICMVCVLLNLQITLRSLIPDLLRAFAPSIAPLGVSKVEPDKKGSNNTRRTSFSTKSTTVESNSPKSPKGRKTSFISTTATSESEEERSGGSFKKKVFAPPGQSRPAKFKVQAQGKKLGFKCFKDKVRVTKK